MKIIDNKLPLTCMSQKVFRDKFKNISKNTIQMASYGSLTFLYSDDVLHSCYLKNPQKSIEGITTTETKESLPQFKEIITIGTPFQEHIWKILMHIPTGSTKTYKDIAILAGNPKASRAVGQAIGSNPVGVLIPCHRVISSNGHLGGFYWGIDIKKKWLESENSF